MQQEKTRLNKDEQAKLMELAGIMQLTYDLTRTDTIDWMLDKIPNGKREMKTLRTKSVRMFEKLCAVTPYKTLNAMQQTLKKLRCTIGVPLIGHENTHNAELGWVVSFDDLSTLTAGCKDMCMLCDKSGAELSKCKLRKVFERLPTPDEPEPMGGGCGYKRLVMDEGADI